MAEVVRGDRLLVGTGEVVPVDGRLLAGGLLDESALTGEPLPVERPAGDEVRSGVVNAGAPFDLVATAVAAESTYAGLVRLVEQAQAASAPFVRAADRLAVVFVPLTLLLAGVAWALSGDPVRAVAVLVVATPCPLLLAAPIAFISGLSRAARAGVVSRAAARWSGWPGAGDAVRQDRHPDPGPARARRRGHLRRHRVDADELLRLAASLDQVSPHVLAGAVVSAAARRELALEMPRRRRRGARLRPAGHGRPPRGQAGQGLLDRRRKAARLGAARSVGARTWTARSPCSPRSTASRPARSCSRT